MATEIETEAQQYINGTDTFFPTSTYNVRSVLGGRELFLRWQKRFCSHARMVRS